MASDNIKNLHGSDKAQNPHSGPGGMSMDTMGLHASHDPKKGLKGKPFNVGGPTVKPTELKGVSEHSVSKSPMDYTTNNPVMKVKPPKAGMGLVSALAAKTPLGKNPKGGE